MFSGKIVIATKKTIGTAVNISVDPTSRLRLTQERIDIPVGTTLACVYHYVPETPHIWGKPTTPYLFVIFGEKVWEVSPLSFFAIENPNALDGKTLCFTGQDDRFGLSREFWKCAVEAHGGEYSSGRTKRLSFLVCGQIPGTTTKLQRAKANNTPCIDYAEFRKMLFPS